MFNLTQKINYKIKCRFKNDEEMKEKKQKNTYLLPEDRFRKKEVNNR